MAVRRQHRAGLAAQQVDARPRPRPGFRSFRQTLSSQGARPLVGTDDAVSGSGYVDLGLDRGEKPRRLGRRREAEQRRRERLDLRRGGAVRSWGAPARLSGRQPLGERPRACQRVLPLPPTVSR